MAFRAHLYGCCLVGGSGWWRGQDRGEGLDGGSDVDHRRGVQRLLPLVEALQHGHFRVIWTLGGSLRGFPPPLHWVRFWTRGEAWASAEGWADSGPLHFLDPDSI